MNHISPYIITLRVFDYDSDKTIYTLTNILGGPLYVIVEYCEHGNLRDFLRRHDSRNEGYERPNSERLIISERTLVSFARQVRKFNFQVTKFTWNSFLA